jgi:TonB family protein
MGRYLIKHILYVFLLPSVFCSLFNCGHSRYRSPRVAADVELDYPIAAQLERIEGQVQVAVYVTEEGKAEEVKLEKSSGYKILDDAALEFSKTIKFIPGMLDKNPISSWTRLVLRYKLSEVYFDKERWLNDVLLLHQQIESVGDDRKEQNRLLRQLYTNNAGLVNYVKKYDDISINTFIRATVTNTIRNRYNDFWNAYAAPCAALDDFLERYPDSEFEELVKRDLTKELVDMEYEIRMASLKSERDQQKNQELIKQIEKRLDVLQQQMLDNN